MRRRANYGGRTNERTNASRIAREIAIRPVFDVLISSPGILFSLSTIFFGISFLLSAERRRSRVTTSVVRRRPRLLIRGDALEKGRERETERENTVTTTTRRFIIIYHRYHRRNRFITGCVIAPWPATVRGDAATRGGSRTRRWRSIIPTAIGQRWREKSRKLAAVGTGRAVDDR